jgi:hypothetical protein
MEIERLPFGQSLADKIRAAHYKWVNMPPGLTSELASKFMLALHGGKTIRKLTDSAGPDYICSVHRFKAHCGLHPDWAAEARRISTANGLIGKGVRLRNLTHCKYGHPLFGANISREPNGRRKCPLGSASLA